MAGGLLKDPGKFSDTKQCPFCAETIKKEAIVCRFCGRDLVERRQSAESAQPQAKAPARPKTQKKKRNNLLVLFLVLVGGFLLCVCFALAVGNSPLAAAPRATPTFGPSPTPAPTPEDTPLTPEVFVERFNQEVGGFAWEKRHQNDGVVWYKGVTGGEYYQKINIFTYANDENRIESLDFFFWYPNGRPEPFTADGLRTIAVITSIALPEWEDGAAWAKTKLSTMAPYEKRETIRGDKMIWLEVGRGSETATLVSLAIFEDSDQ